MLSRSHFGVWSAILCTCLWITASAAFNDSAASTFVAQGGNPGANFTFSLNVPIDSDDLFFHMAGPQANSWMAVGIGSQMEGALMFIAYVNGNQSNVTVSPRIATGENEPSYTSNYSVEVLIGSNVTNGTYEVNARCVNCKLWNGTTFDLNSTTQPWIFALGPDVDLNSDSLTANLRRHANYGQFTMDMVQATGEAFVPSTQTALSGAALVGSVHDDVDFALIFHALIMCGAFVLLFPIGVLWLRLFGKINLHYINNVITVLLVLVGLGLGVKVSGEYNQSKNFTGAHQIIGILVVLACIVQVILGFAHHSMFMRLQRPTPMGLVHRILGPGLIVVALVNGVIAFVWASRPKYIVPYAIIIVAVALVCAGVLFLKGRRDRRKAVYNTSAAQNFNEGLYQQEQSNIQLNPMGGPVGYEPRYDPQGRRMG
ncbi:MAG: hypothetical protein M1838_001138 [Thelocarpon superellum]|nr:MAG: hypothetical protein M1838_001138 [Thelocarpon superellum]